MEIQKIQTCPSGPIQTIIENITGSSVISGGRNSYINFLKWVCVFEESETAPPPHVWEADDKHADDES